MNPFDAETKEKLETLRQEVEALLQRLCTPRPEWYDAEDDFEFEFEDEEDDEERVGLDLHFKPCTVCDEAGGCRCVVQGKASPDCPDCGGSGLCPACEGRGLERR